MARSRYRFVFECAACRAEATIDEEFDEEKMYTCPKCSTQGIIARKQLKYRAKMSPFTFRCPHCDTIQRTYDFDHKRDQGAYHVTELDCPGCGKHVVLKEETPFHYFVEQYRRRISRG